MLKFNTSLVNQEEQKTENYSAKVLNHNIAQGNLQGVIINFEITATSGMTTAVETLLTELNAQIECKLGGADMGDAIPLHAYLRLAERSGGLVNITATATAHSITCFVPFDVLGIGNILDVDSQNVLNVIVTWSTVTGSGVVGTVRLISVFGSGTGLVLPFLSWTTFSSVAAGASVELNVNARNINEIYVYDPNAKVAEVRVKMDGIEVQRGLGSDIRKIASLIGGIEATSNLAEKMYPIWGASATDFTDNYNTNTTVKLKNGDSATQTFYVLCLATSWSLERADKALALARERAQIKLFNKTNKKRSNALLTREYLERRRVSSARVA